MLHSQSMYSYLCVGEDTDSCNKNISVKRERRWRVAEKMRESALVWTGTAVTLGTCSWSFDFPISVFLSVVQGGCETRGSDCVWGAKSPPSRTSYKEPIREIGTPCCHKHCLMSVCHFNTISVYLPICLLDKGGSISFFSFFFFFVF